MLRLRWYARVRGRRPAPQAAAPTPAPSRPRGGVNARARWSRTHGNSSPPAEQMQAATSPLLAPMVVAAARKKEALTPSDRAVAPSPGALAEVSNLIQTSHAPSISIVKRIGATIGHVPSSPEALPTEDEIEPTVFALAEQASPLPRHKFEKSLMTPWGYKQGPASPAEAACKSTGATSSSSWQEVRAGLLSPPPLATTLLASPMQADGQEAANEADGDKEEDDEQQERPAEPAMGRGGWLVNLVDYLQPQPSTATADDEA